MTKQARIVNEHGHWSLYLDSEFEGNYDTKAEAMRAYYDYDETDEVSAE